MDIERASFDWTDVFPVTQFLYYLRRFEDGFFVLANSSGSVIGYAILANTHSLGYVLSIAVHPKNRNQGYAGMLLNFLETKCREKGLSKLRLDVRINNTTAIELYKKLGLMEIRRKSNFYGNGIDALLMEKTVTLQSEQTV